MTSLGFENYAEALKIYLSKYREVSLQQTSAQIVYALIITRHSLHEPRTRIDQQAAAGFQVAVRSEALPEAQTRPGPMLQINKTPLVRHKGWILAIMTIPEATTAVLLLATMALVETVTSRVYYHSLCQG